MAEDLEYIDRFYKGDLSPAELKEFERRVKEDPAFANEIAFYATALQAMRDEIAEEKKKRFREIYKNSNQPGASRPVRKLWPYMVAAAVVLGIIIASYTLFIWTSATSPQELAETYLKEQLQTISVTMSSKPDSLQQGKNLYNDGELSGALRQFESLAKSDTSDTEAKKFAGLTSLRLQQYDKALRYFGDLENYPGLYANPGKFYHALTLLKRNQAGDAEAAKQLLQQVVENDLDKKEIAERWLKKW